MSRTRKATISPAGALGANPEATMDFTAQNASFTGSSYFNPAGGGTPASSAATAATNGHTALMGRNYTVTALYAASHNNADDSNEIMHLLKNGVDTGIIVTIPLGAKVGSTTGLALAMSAGDELCWQCDAAADASPGPVELTVHCEPR